MYATQSEAYRTVQKTTLSGREVEASALTQAALKLTECQRNWDDPQREAKVKEALRINQMIWSIFQADLSKDDNPLPKNIRQDIMSLSVFLDKRIFDFMAAPAPEKLDMIIKINLNVAAGLRGKP